MKIKLKNKLLIILIALVIITIGVSYAIWIITKKQTGENVVSTSCLNIELTNEEDSISLINTFPINDVEGLSLKPYKFTIHNKCDDYVDYSINLEMLSETSLASENIKVLLNKVKTETNPKLLNAYPQNEVPKLEDSKESRQLTIGRLRKLESVNYELRLWLKEELTIESGIENQIAKSKIVVEGKVGEQVASDYIEELAKTDETNLAYDNTKDNNLRYIGADPNNYVNIGDGSLWRIIGVMNNITSLDDIEKQENLVKIIRAESIGEYIWDSSPSGINNGYGINEWSEADIMKLLNPKTVYNSTQGIGESLYWNIENGYCYSGANEVNSPCDFTNKGLNDSAKEKIAKVKWNTGTNEYQEITAKYMYDAERSNHNGKEICEANGGNDCNDTVPRTTTWNGYIGLIYPSDYGYAIGGSIRTKCLNISMHQFNQNDCTSNNWLNYGDATLWTMIPVQYLTLANGIFDLNSIGNIDGNMGHGLRSILPVAYLKSNIKIIENPNNEVEYGSKLNPFQLEI